MQLITGINLTADKISWSSLRRDRNLLSVAGGSQGVALDGISDSWNFANEELSGALKKVLPHNLGKASLALPLARVFTRVMDLPALDPKELAGMVDLQVDKLAPFPVEQLLVGFEVLATRETTSRVLIAAAPRDLVEAAGSAFKRAGVTLLGIDLATLCFWQTVQDQYRSVAWQWLLIWRDEDVEVIVVQNGLPLLFRSLGQRSLFDTPEGAAELRQELDYTLSVLESEEGSALQVPLDIWSASGLEDSVLAVLQGGAYAPVTVKNLAELAAVSEGIARRATAKVSLNLAPAEWLSDDYNRQVQRQVLRIAAVFLAGWAVAVMAFGFGYSFESNKLERMRRQSSSLDSRAQEVRQLKNQATSLEQYADRSTSSLECLLEITRFMPRGVFLTSFVYKKGNQIGLRGEAEREEPIYNFIEALGKSHLFKEVKASGISSRKVGGTIKTEFNLIINLPEGAQTA